MDDTFVVCNEDSDRDEILQKFNNDHNLIRFSIDSEDNYKIHFLDVLLKRRLDDSLKRSIY